MSSNTTEPSSPLELILAMLSVRIWLAIRSLQTGIEKFSGTSTGAKPVEIDGAVNDYGLTEGTTTKIYSLEEYSGVPTALYDKFEAEPLIPKWGLDLYDLVLGPALIILGITLLLGVATRYTLFAMALMYTSLTFGLILIKQDAGISWLAVHIILIVAGLALAKHNRFAVMNKF